MHDLIDFWYPKSISLALIDYANIVCIPREKPRCEICNLRDICTYYECL